VGEQLGDRAKGTGGGSCPPWPSLVPPMF